MNGAVYAASCPTLESNLSLHSSSHYSDCSGTIQRQRQRQRKHGRRRLSSTGDADTSATSSNEGSEGSSVNSDDQNQLDPVSHLEREQLESFFRGLKSQVNIKMHTHTHTRIVKE